MIKLSKMAYAEYWCRPIWDREAGKFRTHAHFKRYGDGVQDEYITEDELIEMASELAEEVAICSKDRHEGHAYAHESDEPALAGKAVMEQIANKDFDAEWKQQLWLQRMYKKWGGHIPAAVLVPDEHDPNDWNAIIPHEVTGDPMVYKANPELTKELPSPKEMGARKRGPGYYLPKSK